MLFSLAAPPLLLGLTRLFARRPAARLEGRLPARLTAGRSVSARVDVVLGGRRRGGPHALYWDGPLPDPPALEVLPGERTLAAPAASPVSVAIDLHPRRRGRYVLPRLGLARTDLFGLVRTRAVWLPETVVLAYPRYHTLDALPLPDGPTLPAGRHPARLGARRLARVRGHARVPRGRPAAQDRLAVVGPPGAAGGQGVPGGVLLAHRARARHLPAAQAPARASARGSKPRSRCWPPWPTTSAAARRSSTSWPQGRTSTR